MSSWLGVVAQALEGGGRKIVSSRPALATNGDPVSKTIPKKKKKKLSLAGKRNVMVFMKLA
jgi:hypothetical protein